MTRYEFKSNSKYFLKATLSLMAVVVICTLFVFFIEQATFRAIGLAIDVSFIFFLGFILKRAFNKKALVLTETEIAYFGKKIIDVSNVEYAKLDYQIEPNPKSNETIQNVSQADTKIDDMSKNLEFVIKPKNTDRLIYKNYHPMIVVTSKELSDALTHIGVNVK